MSQTMATPSTFPVIYPNISHAAASDIADFAIGWSGGPNK
jgi:hypothetical protein